MATNGTVVALTQSTVLFVTLLPDPDAMRNNTSEGFASNTRTREFAAACLSVGTGIALSFLEHDPGPFYISLVVSFGLIAASEFLLSSPPQVRN